MFTKRIFWLAAVGIVLSYAARPTLAQEATPSKANSGTTALTTFRLDFAMSEWEDGKKINTRHYSMNLALGGPCSLPEAQVEMGHGCATTQGTNEIKIGTRVPLQSKQDEMQYLDIGTNIWAKMTLRGDAFQLEVRADLSSIAQDRGNLPSSGLTANAPLVRQLKINASTVATLGKPTVVGVVDDPNSKRQYQLEVTVTQLK